MRVWRESVWHFEDRVFNYAMQPQMGCWLFDPTSLTARLLMACEGRFSVQVLSQRWANPLRNESRRLGLGLRQTALIREVFLYCDQTPWVFARTVIPRSTLTGKLKYLAKLGSRPLGAVLFSDPHMRRDQFEVADIQPGEYLYTQATQHCQTKPTQIWGRRSAFYLSQKPLLVNEIFLPTIAPCPRVGYAMSRGASHAN